MSDRIDPTAERRAELRAMGLLALLITVLYADVLFLGANFFTRDLTTYHYPMKWIVREAVLGGDFPYWNRLYSGGQPMAANPAYEVFYPPQWLTLLPDYNFGFRLHIVVHVFVAVFGAFRFFRSIELGVAASAVGAMVFVTCGPYVSVMNLLPFLFSISWAPWIALYARRWLLERRSRDFVLGALFLGMQALICEPTTLLQTWGVIALYAVVSGWRREGVREAVSRLARSAGLIAMGIAVAAIQFVPAADHARDSVRSLGFPLWQVETWSFAPARILEFAFPNILGTSEAHGLLYWGGRFLHESKGPFLYSIYVSLAIGALVLAGVSGRVAGRGFASAVTLCAVVLAVGKHTPIIALLHGAGLIPSIRYPEKFMLSASFALITYGVIVLDRVFRGDGSVARRAAWICGAAGAIGAIVFFICLHPEYPAWFGEFWGVNPAARASIARTQWLVAAVRGLAFAFVMRSLAADTGRKPIALLILFLIADLMPLGNQINPRVDRSYFDEPPPIARRLDLRGSRLVHVAATQTKTPELGRYFLGLNGYWVIRNGLWNATGARWGIPTCLELDVDETQLVKTRVVLELAETLSKRGVHDWVSVLGPMYGSGPVLVYRDPEKELQRIRGDWSVIEPVEIEPTPHYPRYFFASQMVEASDDSRLTDMLVRERWDPRTAFVRSGARAVEQGRVISARELGNRTVIEVEASADAFLVLASTHHKYWRATLDGLPTDITLTNIAFQGIAVPKGRHLVELNYYNPIISIGAIVTLVSLAVLGLVWLRGAGQARGGKLEA